VTDADNNIPSEPTGDHSFRISRPPRHVSRDFKKRFNDSHTQLFKEWSEYHHNKRVIEDELTRRLFGTTELSDAAKKSLEILRPDSIPPLRRYSISIAQGRLLFLFGQV